MFETEIQVNRFLLNYAENLMKEIPNERMAEQPAPGINHPAWILGHLAFTGDSIVGLLGGDKTLPEGGAKQFGPNSTPVTNRADYPSTEELLNQLRERFETAQKLASTIDPALVAAENPRPHMREGLPTVGDLVAFVMTGHFGIHVGQLSTWRRLIGMPRLF